MPAKNYMDDVTREAQNRGYDDGHANRSDGWKRHGYAGHLRTAYDRGWSLGHADYLRTLTDTPKGDDHNG